MGDRGDPQWSCIVLQLAANGHTGGEGEAQHREGSGHCAARGAGAAADAVRPRPCRCWHCLAASRLAAAPASAPPPAPAASPPSSAAPPPASSAVCFSSRAAFFSSRAAFFSSSAVFFSSRTISSSHCTFLSFNRSSSCLRRSRSQELRTRRAIWPPMAKHPTQIQRVVVPKSMARQSTRSCWGSRPSPAWTGCRRGRRTGGQRRRAAAAGRHTLALSGWNGMAAAVSCSAMLSAPGGGLQWGEGESLRGHTRLDVGPSLGHFKEPSAGE